MHGLLLYLKKQAHLYCYRITNLFNFLWFSTSVLATTTLQKELSHKTRSIALATES